MSTTNGDDRAAVARRIVQARNELGIKQKEFAELAHVTVRTITSWETGEVIPFKRLDEIAAILQKPKQWLLHGDDSSDPSGEIKDLMERLVMNQLDIIDQIKLLRLELKGTGEIPF